MRSLAAAALFLAAAAGCRYDSATLGGPYATGTVSSLRTGGLLVGNSVQIDVTVFQSDAAQTRLSQRQVRLECSGCSVDAGPALVTDDYGYTSGRVTPSAAGAFTVRAFIQPKGLPEIEILPPLELTAVALPWETVVLADPQPLEAGVVVGLAAADVTDDGVPDLVAIQSTLATGVQVFGGGYGLLTDPPVTHALFGVPSLVATARFTTATRPTIVIARTDPTSKKNLVELFSYDKTTGALVVRGKLELQSEAKALVGADLGNSGTALAVVAEPLLPGNGSPDGGIELVSLATGTPQATSFPVPTPLALAVGRVDGDAIDDVVVAFSGTTPGIVVVYGAAGLALGRNTMFGVKPAATVVAIADVTGDGLADLITGNAADATYPNRLIVWAQNTPAVAGDLPSFATTPVQTVTLDGAPAALAVGDLNGDGHDDVAVVYQGTATGSARLLVLVQTGGILQPQAEALVIPDRPVSVCIGDFDHDSLADVAVASYGQPIKIFRGR